MAKVPPVCECKPPGVGAPFPVAAPVNGAGAGVLLGPGSGTRFLQAGAGLRQHKAARRRQCR